MIWNDRKDKHSESGDVSNFCCQLIKKKEKKNQKNKQRICDKKNTMRLFSF
jgi:hypothetical protein